MLPDKKVVIGSLVVFAVLMIAYNKVPQVRKVLGGA